MEKCNIENNEKNIKWEIKSDGILELVSRRKYLKIRK